MNLKVADTDSFCSAGLINLLQTAPCIQVTSGNRPVNQIKIHIVQLKTFKTPLKSPINISDALCSVPYFRGDEKFTSGNG